MSLNDALEAMRTAVANAEAKARAQDELIRRQEKTIGDLEDQVFELQQMLTATREAAAE